MKAFSQMLSSWREALFARVSASIKPAYRAGEIAALVAAGNIPAGV